MHFSINFRLSKYVCGFLGVILLGCQNQNISTGKPLVNPSSKPSSAIMPGKPPSGTPSPEQTLSATAPPTQPSFQPSSTVVNTDGLEVFGNGTYCKPEQPLNQIKASLKLPFDLAVSQDGSRIYVVNKRCDTRYSAFPYASFSALFEGTDCTERFHAMNTLVERHYIYLIEKGEVQVLTVNGGGTPYSCAINDEIEIDDADNIYLTSLSKHQIYKISPDRTFSPVGEFVQETTSSNDLNPSGKPVMSNLVGPTKLAITNNELYFSLFAPVQGGAKTEIRKVLSDKESIVQTAESFSGEGVQGLVKTKEALIYSIERGLRKFTFSSLKNQPFVGFETYKEGQFNYTPTGFQDGTREQARFALPLDLKEGSSGDIYVVDMLNHAIRKVSPSGQVSTVAGNGKPGYSDGTGSGAQFRYPTSIDLDKVGNIFVADIGNHAIRKITPAGLVTTLYKAPD